MANVSNALPIFPLTGTLLLPGNFLPLNIFEPRYRNMIDDVLQTGGVIGMIQPAVPSADGFGPPPGEVIPELYEVGCMGEIAQSEQQPDGRYVIVLRGTQRFRVARELSEVRGYRRVLPDSTEFVADLSESEIDLDPKRLLGAVERLGIQLDLDLDLLRSLPGVTLLNGLAAALPISPVEKQALLEAPSVRRREELLIEVLAMGFDVGPEHGGGPAVSLVN